MVVFNTNSYFNNIAFKASISDKDIDSLKDAKQHFSDCYIMATLETLSQTENGRKVLKEQIQRDDADPNKINCYFYTKSGAQEKYTIPTNTVIKGYEKVYDKQPNEIIRSVDISVSEYEKKYDSKPTISKIGDKFKDFSFEYNLPSNFMRMLTGVKPTVIGETDLNINLTNYKEEVMQLFKRMDEEDKHSFVISTGIKALDGHRWHVYIIQDVDLENNTITVKEKRGNKPQTLTIDEALKTFKFIAGYFNSDLENKL
ncbi:hypothetical protein IJ384_00140 [bacterium]|nr:hypothetical protein [bacterium]